MLGHLVSLLLVISVSQSRPIAAVFGTPNYHQEVTSVLTCALHTLGYDVYMYVRTLLYPEPFVEDSIAFYGHCIRSWINMSDYDIKDIHLIPNTSIFLIPTFYPFPVKYRNDGIYGYYDLLREFSLRTNGLAVFVNHRVFERSEVLHDMGRNTISPYTPDIERIIPRNRTIYLFLSNHTEQYAKRLFFDALGGYRTAHMYPVLPLPMVVNSSFTSTFAVQGNFGGIKHGFRRNPGAVVACIARLEGVLDRPLGVVFIGRGEIAGLQLSRGDVRHLANLSSLQFYQAIAGARFLVPAIATEVYFRGQASSSIPAALMTGVPVVTSRAFLRLYPCLAEARVHRRISGESECATMEAALRLNAGKYEELRGETRRCAAEYWQNTLLTLKRLIALQPAVSWFPGDIGEPPVGRGRRAPRKGKRGQRLADKLRGTLALRAGARTATVANQLL